MIHLIRRVRINDKIPTMYHNDVLIKNAYRKETLIVGEYEVNPDPSPYAVKYFCIESLEDNNTITFTKVQGAPNNTYYVSTDLNTWTEYYGTQSWTINSNGKLYFKSNANNWYTPGTEIDIPYWWYFSSNKTCNINGNIMSLIYGDDFAGVMTMKSDYQFTSLFSSYSPSYYHLDIVDASNLVLPATTLTYGCYSGMFYGCTSLMNAPKLPATNLAENCYTTMFSGCTSLVTAPALPATTLATSCYAEMFNGCIALVNAPTLPATTLAEYCYRGMFWNCTSLRTAPELPATTLAAWCYRDMFAYCNKLNYIKCLATDISASHCLYYWVSDVAASGRFVKAASMSSWPSGASGIPLGWTVQNA